MIIRPVFDDNSNIPLSEYPRPQFKRDSYYPLNGRWYYDITKAEDKPDFRSEIIVPYSPESKLSEVGHVLQKDEVLWYKRTFSLDKEFVSSHVFLNIGACDQISEVCLNGNFVGKHLGGYNSFSFEISRFLSQENELIIKVTDNATSDIYGRGKQKYKNGGIWYTPISGIWQSIWLESVPEEYIHDLQYIIDSNKKELRIIVDNVGISDRIYVKVVDGETVKSDKEYPVSDVIVDISSLKEWSPDNPELYGLVLDYSDDHVESYFGIRSFSRKTVNSREYFALNDKPYFQNGILDQGYFEDGIYTCKSNKAMYDELSSIKELGFNMLRKHIKVEPMLWYYYCDVLGILVWQDMINGGKPYNPLRIAAGAIRPLRFDDTKNALTGRSEESKRFFLQEAGETIKQLYNTVCISTWTIFNEGWGQFDSLIVAEKLKSLDNTRLFDNASGWVDTGKGDYSSHHIYFRTIRLTNDRNRILALTEFGGYSFKDQSDNGKAFGYRMYKDRNKLEKAISDLFHKEVIPMIESEGMSVSVYTQLTDVEGEVNGIFTADRKLKISKDTWKEINKSIYESFERSIANE
ncbi:MAG: glycoside hydrolase family 2 [Clostridiales bacterium]|nr:glycoside hydrolase family 2 [Clostridiales bacterium]